MYSQRKFTPGSSNNTSRMITYVAEYNSKNLNEQIPCLCINNNYDKSIPSSDSPSRNITSNALISQIIKYGKGGKFHYGGFYLGQPLQLNYLGRNEGMPGGSGRPPLNKF